MTRISRSFQLVAQSYRVLMQDKELMILPLISGALMIGVAASFFFGLGIESRLDDEAKSELLLPGFLFYVVTYAIGIFFQAAIVAGATERLRGGDPTIGSALAAAGRRIVPILMWAVVAATVGMLLRALQDRAGFIGKNRCRDDRRRMVARDVLRGAGAGAGGGTDRLAFGRSFELFRKTWGESFVGGITIGVAGVCAWVTLIAVVGLLAWAGLGVATFVVGAAGAIFPGGALPGARRRVRRLALEYATRGTTPNGLRRGPLLSQAFVPKR